MPAARAQPLLWLRLLLAIAASGSAAAHRQLVGAARRGLFAATPTVVWNKHPGSKCSTATQSYATLAQAQGAALAAQPSRAVYDATCNGVGPYALCPPSTVAAGAVPEACVWVHGALATTHAAAATVPQAGAPATGTNAIRFVKVYAYAKRADTHCADSTRHRDARRTRAIVRRARAHARGRARTALTPRAPARFADRQVSLALSDRRSPRPSSAKDSTLAAVACRQPPWRTRWPPLRA